MAFGIGTYGLGYLAGVLSTLSPCVLPLVPVVLASALAAHRFGALALTAGLMLSFTAAGMFVAIIGASLGIDDAVFRHVAAIPMMGTGMVLMVPALQERFSVSVSGASNAGHALLSAITIEGLFGQFFVGLILGLVWSPCVGPTLGAAVTLAAQGRELGKVAFMMALFGLGAGTPMLILGSVSRSAVSKFRHRLAGFGNTGKSVFGVVVLLLGAASLAGFDKDVETLMVRISPAWLVDISSRY